MATLVPFSGLRYADALRPRLPRLVTPPYDIISPRDQAAFYRMEPRNIIRLEYGRVSARDTDADNRYTRAQATLDDWLARGVLVREARPAFYLMQTTFTDPFGRTRVFNGLYARVKLEPLGKGSILPHERTFAGPKADRLHLLAATGVSFSPVFSLYPRADAIRKRLDAWRRRRPWAEFRDWSGARHRLWIEQRPAELAALRRAFSRQTLLIADGHHRYSTALNYREQCGAAAGPDADYVMMCLAESGDPGLTVLPVYRLVSGLTAAAWKRFAQAAPEFFEIEAVAPARLQEAQWRAAERTGRVVIGCLGGLGRGGFLLTLKAQRPGGLFRAELPGASETLRGLDLVVIDQLLLGRLLGVPPGDEAGRVRYTKDAAEARRVVARGEVQAALLPCPPRLETIWALARGGEVMPQKSTYFLPKLVTGLVMNPVALEP